MAKPGSQRRLARRRLVLAGVTVGLLLAGCGRSPSTLDPAGPKAERVAGLWWLMFWISVAVFALVVVLLVLALARRRGRRDEVVRSRGGEWLVWGGGVVLPVVVLSAVYLVMLGDMRGLAEPPGRAEVTVEVVGHDWWWEVRYPDLGIVTANEITIPAGRPVHLRLTSADVIHSFWVPELAPKTDLLPGHVNETWIQASSPGVYRGQCAEYCGLQHAKMALLVIAEPADRFQAWAAGQRRSAAQPTGRLAAQGRAVFERSSCAACHAVRGTTAAGTRGPDLTHFGSRRTIGAATIPNTRGHLGGWIVNSQTVKPGNLMPPTQVGAEELQALLAYLESLK